jgi:hypothetical protein
MKESDKVTRENISLDKKTRKNNSFHLRRR